MGVPRGADDPQGPIGREQAGPPARHPDGALGGCPSHSSGHPHRAPAPGSAPTKADPPSSRRRPGPCGPPLVLVRADPPVRTLGRRLGSQSLPAARQVRGCRRPPRFCRTGTARVGWQPPGQGARRTGPEALRFLQPRNLGAFVCLERRSDRGCFSRFGLVLPGRGSPVILALFRRRSPWFPLREVGPWLRHPSYHLIR